MTALSNSTPSGKPGSLAGVRNTLPYILIGGGIGAALALLFAPKSGTELRTDISDLTRKGYDETINLAQRLKEQSAGIYQTVKDKTDQAYDLAATKLSLAQSKIDDTLEAAENKVNGQIRQLEDKATPRNTGGARKSASIV